MLLVYLDPYHLGDPLFLDRFARDVQAHAGPLLLVHGGGEAAERALEAEGFVPERVHGALRVADARQAALVERAARDLNRRIVHALNETGVSALRVAGTDRGLLRHEADGALHLGKTDWLAALAGQGVVPVLATLGAREDGTVVEADPAAVCAGLAEALATGEEPAPVLCLARREGEAAAPEVARQLEAKGVRVHIGLPAQLRGMGPPGGAGVRRRGAAG